MAYAFFGVFAGFSFALFLSKAHLAQYSLQILMTSVELGMGFAIIFLFMMIGCDMWHPKHLSMLIREGFPTEDFLITHLCLKWDIDNELPKLEKLTRIKQTLQDALHVKAEFDKRARQLAADHQPDPLVYKKLIEGPLWDQMDDIIDEMLN